MPKTVFPPLPRRSIFKGAGDPPPPTRLVPVTAESRRALMERIGKEVINADALADVTPPVDTPPLKRRNPVKGVLIGVRVQPNLLAHIDAASKSGERRPETVRRLLMEIFGDGG